MKKLLVIPTLMTIANFGGRIASYANESDNIPDTSQLVVANDLTCTAKRDAYIRLVPDGDSIGTIHKGEIFAPIEVKDDWIHTQVNRSLHGWISNTMASSPA